LYNVADVLPLSTDNFDHLKLVIEHFFARFILNIISILFAQKEFSGGRKCFDASRALAVK